MSTCTSILCKCADCQDLMSNWSEKFLIKDNPFLKRLKEIENQSPPEEKQETKEPDKK